jgi:hypothetical protein
MLRWQSGWICMLFGLVAVAFVGFAQSAQIGATESDFAAEDQAELSEQLALDEHRSLAPNLAS